MTNTWTINSDGSVTFDGTVQFPAGTNLASGAGIAIFGPNGGTTNFPAIEAGPPGDTPTLSFSMVQVAYGTALPTPNPAVVETPGTPPNYALTFYVNAGEPGTSAANTLISPQPTDLEGTPAAGYLIGYDATNSKAQWQPSPAANWYFSNSFAATASNTSALKGITSVTIPALPYAWWPEVFGCANVIGAVDTRVDLVARLNSTTGTICGYGAGSTGFSGAQFVIPNNLYVGSASIIAANAGPTTVYFNAENQTSSSNPWNTGAGGQGYFFQVRPSQVPA